MPKDCKVVESSIDVTFGEENEDWFIRFACGDIIEGISKMDRLFAISRHVCSKDRNLV